MGKTSCTIEQLQIMIQQHEETIAQLVIMVASLNKKITECEEQYGGKEMHIISG